MQNLSKNHTVLSKLIISRILPVFLLASISLSSLQINSMDRTSNSSSRVSLAICIAGVAAACWASYKYLQQHQATLLLIDAARDNNLAQVNETLAADTNVNAKNNDGDTALLWAAYSYRGHTEICTQLIAAGADVNAKNNYGKTALMCAAQCGHTEIYKQLITAGANVNAKDNDGNTALLWGGGHTEICTQLIAAGADVNARNDNGNTALTPAANRGNTEICAQLIAAGAEIPADLRDHAAILAVPENLRNTPPLMRALTSGYYEQVVRAFSNPETLALLMSYDLRSIDFAQHKFMINPGVQILPDLDLIATGKIRISGEYGTELTPEKFSILDLAILTCQPDLVDKLLMSGMSPACLTQQTRELLSHIAPPELGVSDAKGTESNEEQIAHMLYYADLAQSDEIQNRVRRIPGRFNTTAPLPELVVRYARATPEFQAWQASQATMATAPNPAGANGGGPE